MFGTPQRELVPLEITQIDPRGRGSLVYGRLNKLDVGKVSPGRIFNSYAMGQDGDDQDSYKRVPFDSGFILTNNSLTGDGEREGVSSY